MQGNTKQPVFSLSQTKEPGYVIAAGFIDLLKHRSQIEDPSSLSNVELPDYIILYQRSTKIQMCWGKVCVTFSTHFRSEAPPRVCILPAPLKRVKRH